MRLGFILYALDRNRPCFAGGSKIQGICDRILYSGNWILCNVLGF